jgi:PAS domain S-box-containing protein
MRDPSGETGWERLFRLMFERTANPVILLDEERLIVDLNDPAVVLLGGPRERLIGSSMVDSVRPLERARSSEEWHDFLRSGEYSGTRALLTSDGAEVQVEFAARLAPVDRQRVAVYVLMAQAAPETPEPHPPPELGLTAREREVVTLIALGRDTGEIAAELHVSSETVRTHVRNAMSKLDVHTRAQLVAVVLCAEHALHGARIVS